MLLAMPEITFQVVALGLERVVILILHLPSGATVIDAPIEMALETDFGWRKYAQSGVEVYEVSGDYFSAIALPHVTTLAEKLNYLMAKH